MERGIGWSAGERKVVSKSSAKYESLLKTRNGAAQKQFKFTLLDGSRAFHIRQSKVAVLTFR
jgi:hypothetical protein